MTKALKNAKPVKKKKTKTFTGCATCRSRKIKCDLGKPFCKRCEKSGLICAGYQINLCWSRPIKFDKYGYQLPASSKDDNDDDEGNNNEKSFQRRNIDFVKYDREYETYEEMDRDLGLLHSPEYSLIEYNQTWMQGPFGVFEGLRNIPSHLMRKRRKLNKTKYRNNADSPSSINQDNRTESPILNHNKTSNNNDSSNIRQKNGEVNVQLGNIFEEQNKLNNLNNEWLSNELRYDAMLSATAATFNDNYNNFDFMTPFATTNTDTPMALQNDAFNIPDLYPYDKEVFNVLRSSHPTHLNIENESISQGLNNHTQGTIQEEEVENEEDGDIIISTFESKMPEEIIKILTLPTKENIPSSIPISNTSLQISPLTRFLLQHYINEVADLMTVVAFPKNPWKTIYFPRALRAIGDLSGLGHTPNSRSSLLNALLAVSCFNLQSRYEKGSPETKFFLNLGIELRLQASAFLKKMLESDVPDLKTERYKDVVTAILSMNTIDIVWGTMSDCQYHISVCEEIISKRMIERPIVSHKAKLLHRIFSFLKNMQDSTNFENLNTISDQLREKVEKVFFNTSKNLENFIESPEANKNENGGIKTSNIIDKEEVSAILSERTTPSAYSPAFIDENNTSSSKVSKELLLTDALYGLPNSMILLFSDTVNLLKIRFYIEGKGETETKKEYIDELCLSFESKLLSWINEWKLKEETTGEFLSASHEGIYHHCMSFYNSLIIYYFTMVRDLSHVLLQKYSERCIEHLESLQKLMDQGKIKMIPLFWQGFIGGCSAISPELQNRFKEWAASLSKTGVGSYWGARQIMFEVWRRRDTKQENDSWFSVHKDWEMNIMLS
ncbi:Arginine metabolism regulation protein II [Wickerhamomyces ciferrii]|uniref:Arginine metabolism regulation protein II n=1 Tax=Wickerhamomyces ciferrii (strain ATCC 14091 / BCRC 22168 / CBS 111 / JCM 3599 / NBRC 0793 / NRRL Y-1031 F-60-10) TaxID=1206466 RepID=K0KKF6_WICCF|nr:Arginine metabolism regulation protein II [Wickerhamomyces ciferrii]CCH41954.1 Arginine metabolism regulation protein II [Wickerhamomyces ciferrii]